jgi:hypothetical protein
MILGNFNIDVSNNTTPYHEIKKILNCMNNHNLKQQISIPTTKENSLTNHIWSNIPKY